MHQESYNTVVRNLVHEKKQLEAQNRKVNQLEQRLGLVLDVELPQQDKLRTVLGVLAKDNERLKKEIKVKDSLIKSQQDVITHQKQQIGRASLRLELIKKKISAKDLEAINNEHLSNLNNNSANPNNGVGGQAFFSMNSNGNNNGGDPPPAGSDGAMGNTLIGSSQLPSKLNFRIQILKKEYQTMLFDICESGASQFTTMIVNQAEKVEQMDKISLLA